MKNRRFKCPAPILTIEREKPKQYSCQIEWSNGDKQEMPINEKVYKAIMEQFNLIKLRDIDYVVLSVESDLFINLRHARMVYLKESDV